jgi:hypothetical protein
MRCGMTCIEYVFSAIDLHLKRITIDADAGGDQEGGGGAGKSDHFIVHSSAGLFPGWIVFVLYGPYGPEPHSQKSTGSKNHQMRKQTNIEAAAWRLAKNKLRKTRRSKA